MAQHSATALAPETTFTADGRMRPLPSVLADPAAPESLIMCRPLRQRAILDAAISRAHKSPTLIAHILSNISDAAQFQLWFADVEDMLLALLADPGCNEENVHAIARLHARLSLSPALLSKICVHPLVPRRTVIDTLWRSSTATAEQVGTTTGLLLVAAVNWVSARADRNDRLGRGLWYVDDELEAQILTTTHTWTTWAGTDPGRVAFLAASSAAFTNEDELLAAGAALTGAPTAT